MPKITKPETARPAPERFLSIQDGANYTRMSVAYLWQLIAKGDLPVIRIGKRTLLDRADVDAFLLSRKSKAA